MPFGLATAPATFQRAMELVSAAFMCIKKVDNFETALNLAKRFEVRRFLLIHIAWVRVV